LVENKADIIIIMISSKYNLLSPWCSWQLVIWRYI